VVESVADLRGKKIAVPPPTLQVLILNDVLREAGLELGKDVERIQLGFADHVTAFARGDVDAFMGSEPPVTQAIVEADGVRLPEASQTPVGDFNTANWASAKVLEERPDVVRAVCQMQKQAAELLSPGGVNDAQQWRELLVDQFGFQPVVYENVLDNVGARWKFDEERVAQVKGAATMLQQQGRIAGAQTRLRMHEWLLQLLAERPTTTLLVTHDVEEALLLGDRLCLLSDPPAHVVDTQSVPFGRGRGRAVLADPEFVRMKAAVLERVLAG
jgi:ABC-type nitrate/sulfonate/bicarbonate transport system substrate-binding protein